MNPTDPPIIAPAPAAPIEPPASPAPARPAVARLVSLDAYRGFVMFLMMAEVLRLPKIAQAFPGSAFWQFIGFHTEHVEWVGGSLHDMIQPSFSFMVGVALPFSLASRAAKAASFGSLVAHAAWRALLLVLLGVFLRSMYSKSTNWVFTDTLTQIGLGYVFLFMLGFCTVRAQAIACAAILLVTWATFAAFPLPGPDFDYNLVGVNEAWRNEHMLSGFAAHWNKNSNAAWAADIWIMNLFPRESLWAFSGGGYPTINFIPTLATMILGLIAGGWMRADHAPREKIRRLVLAGVVGLMLGGLLHILGICPIVKRIWTPAWVLYSGGWCFLMLAAFYVVIDVKGWTRVAFPLVVIGMNSIAAYLLAHGIDDFIIKSFKIHFGTISFHYRFIHISERPLHIFGETFEPLMAGLVALTGLWLILLWMYRRKLFLKI